MHTLSFTVDADGIASLTIDLPQRSSNVITPALTADLVSAIERIRSDAAIRGVLLSSAKESCFVAGADITFMLDAFEQGITATQAARLAEPLGNALRQLETCGKPVAAAINGVALGGGLELALACHYRVLARAPKVLVGLPEVGLGLLPGAGGTQRVPRLIGIEKALPLLLTGQQLDPEAALQAGLVHALAEPDQVVPEARRWLLGTPDAVQPWDKKGYRVPGGAGPMTAHAQRTSTAATTLAAVQTQRNLPAPLAILSAVYEGLQLPIDRGLAVERKYFGTLLASDVARNLMRTLFLNKQRCDKLVNRPAGLPKTQVKRLGVLGAGMMGAGIAYVAAQVGIEVVLLDTTMAGAERGKQYAEKVLDKAVSRGRSTPDKAAALLARIRPTADYADLSGCDFVVEAVFEQRDVKAKATAMAGEVMPADAVFGSNTSTLPIGGLAQAFPRPADFIGVHFFSPVERMPLLEIIRGEQTSDATLARALDLAQQLKKTPIVVNDSRGFFTSRTFGAFVKEGVAMLQEGVAPALIENAARQAGLPVGPLAVIDEVSLDITLKVYDQWVADGTPPPFEPALSVHLLRRMTETCGRRGKAAGAGFYDYPVDGPKRLWPGLATLCPPAEVQPDVEELKRRFLTVEALEGARCIDEGVVVDPADADVGSILGIGYPAWTGGVLSYIETVGLPEFIERARTFEQRFGARYAPPADLLRRATEGRRYHPRMTAP